jgi:hypothetical protein
MMEGRLISFWEIAIMKWDRKVYMSKSHPEDSILKSRKISYRSILINFALLAIPIILVAILYPNLPILKVPRLGFNGSYIKTVDKHIYYLLALIPITLYNRFNK